MFAPRVRLVILACLTISTAAAQEQHTVQPQDTLFSLSKRYGTTVEAIQAANGMTDTNLTIGRVLNLPEDAVAAVVAAGAEAAARQAEQAAAPAEEPAEAVSSFPDTDIYTVQPGDSLYAIARAYGYTLEEFMALNGLRTDVINPGQLLKTRGSGGDHFDTIVQPGDNLQRIAERHGVDVKRLADANGITLHTVLNPGHRLIVPSDDFVIAGAQEGLLDMGGAAGPTITVAPGDSLWNIARAHGTTVEQIMSINGLNSDTLRAGQTLRLVPGSPSGGTAPAATATAAGSADMVWPATGIITSRFGWRSLRIGGTNMHYGLDLDGNTGDPIYAATAGVVTFSGWRGGYGNLVIVEADGTEYYYAHASELLVNVGAIVSAGQVIARIGTTGNVTGAHLHFEVRVDGTPVDPLPILEARAGSR